MNAQTRVVVGWISDNKVYMSQSSPVFLDPMVSGDMISRTLQSIGMEAKWNHNAVRELDMLRYHCPSNVITVLSLEPSDAGIRRPMSPELRVHAGSRDGRRRAWVQTMTARMSELYH